MMELVVGQIEGAGAAINAAKDNGWTAVTVVVTFFAFLAFIGVLMRKMFSEKDQLAARLTSVEDFQKKEMLDMHVMTAEACNRSSAAIQANTDAIRRFLETMRHIPCMEPHRKELPG